MDGLYDDLENYNHDTIVEDLKNENQELKVQLNKYSTHLNRLQMDFDRLNAEHKKLEMNYSSLLKTAKSEIERKTKMIKQLNIEKDEFVIKAFQNKGKRFFPHTKPEQGFSKTRDIGRQPVENFSDRANTETKTRVSIPTLETKENIFKNRSDGTCLKIDSRRKSLPATSHVNKPPITSDDENEESDLYKHKKIRDYKYSDRQRDRRFSGKNEKNCDYKTNVEGSERRKHLKHYEDRYRSRDKSRHRRYKSPLSNHWENYGHQQHSRSRSPPSDRFIKKRSHDRLPHIETDSSNEKHTTKHKLLPLSEEPINKKMRTDPDMYQENLNNSLSDGEVVEPSPTLISPVEPYHSCQSPDHIHSHLNDNKTPIKEIMQTADSPQDDPRLTSNKYVLHTENNKICLKTVYSGEICMKLVNQSTWTNSKAPVPDTLLHKPSSIFETNEDIISEIYSNIENFTSEVAFQSRVGDNSPHVTKTIKDDTDLTEKRDTHCPQKMNKKNLDSIEVHKTHTTYDNSDCNVGTSKDNSNNSLKDVGDNHKTQKPFHDIQLSLDATDTEKVPFSDSQSYVDHYQVLHVSGTVEGDLLLSDDASDDNLELQNNTTNNHNLNNKKEKFPLKIKLKRTKLCKKLTDSQNKINITDESLLTQQKDNHDVALDLDSNDDNKSLNSYRRSLNDEHKTLIKSNGCQIVEEDNARTNMTESDVNLSPMKGNKPCGEVVHDLTVDSSNAQPKKSKFQEYCLDKYTVGQQIEENNPFIEIDENSDNKDDLIHASGAEKKVKNSDMPLTKKKNSKNNFKSKKTETISPESNSKSEAVKDPPKKVDKTGKKSKSTKKTTSKDKIQDAKDGNSIDINSKQDGINNICPKETNEKHIVGCETKEGIKSDTFKVALNVNSEAVAKSNNDCMGHVVEGRKKTVSSNKSRTLTKRAEKEEKAKDNTLCGSSTKPTSSIFHKDDAKEVRSKFCELFGDSNSLISPEDLGIPNKVAEVKASSKFECVFDDTQSAVDLSVESIKASEPHKCIATNTVVDNEEVIDTNIKSFKTMNPEDIYENLNTAVSMDSANVVIISKGVQSARSESQGLVDIAKLETVQSTKESQSLALKALATSTPYKIDTDDVNSKPSCLGLTKDITQYQKSQEIIVTEGNTVEHFVEPDIPDVRIFVKRRRKIKKP
ncbi:unnamed protein product [Leptosia nina]|uniref:Uncharacterized protein n=1 Tax=Leptosia nina TaxID=320188 RepID=A0AAV1JVC7_9NEOP